MGAVQNNPLPPVGLLAEQERGAAESLLSQLLPSSSRLSVYLYQPLVSDASTEGSPGTYFDVGPLPVELPVAIGREDLYTCAATGRTGEILDHFRTSRSRLPRTSLIEEKHRKSFETNPRKAFESQLLVEQIRHELPADRFPIGWFVHHLPLAPVTTSYHTSLAHRPPMVGTLLTLTANRPNGDHTDRWEFRNLTDFGASIGRELVDLRVAYLLGEAAGDPGCEVMLSALGQTQPCPDDPLVRTAMRFLLTHHWLWPYSPVAYWLLREALGDRAAVAQLYAQHGWSEPPAPMEVEDRDLLATVKADLAGLLDMTLWHRNGRRIHTPLDYLNRVADRAINSALLLLVGSKSTTFGPRNRTLLYLTFPETLRGRVGTSPLVGLAIPAESIRHQTQKAVANAPRHAITLAACGPSGERRLTRFHIQHRWIIKGFQASGLPLLGQELSDTENANHTGTKWISAYTVWRLTQAAVRAKEDIGNASQPKAK